MIHVAPRALGSDVTCYKVIKLNKSEKSVLDQCSLAFLSQCFPYDIETVTQLRAVTPGTNYILFIEGSMLNEVLNEGINFF